MARPQPHAMLRTCTMVRYFTLGNVENLRIGFEAQSPTGEGCTIDFSEITYRPDLLKGMRTGE